MAESIAPQRKVELLKLGETLLHKPGDELSRSEWSQVLEALFPGGKAAPQESARQLIEALPDSWLKTRSKGAPNRYRQLRATFRELMKLSLPDVELKFLVGWMDRMVRVRDEKKNRERKAKKAAERRGQRTHGGRPS